MREKAGAVGEVTAAAAAEIRDLAKTSTTTTTKKKKAKKNGGYETTTRPPWENLKTKRGAAA